MQRERLQISMQGENLKKIRAMAERLNMSLVDVLEVIIAVYFAYVQKTSKMKKGGND